MLGSKQITSAVGGATAGAVVVPGVPDQEGAADQLAREGDGAKHGHEVLTETVVREGRELPAEERPEGRRGVHGEAERVEDEVRGDADGQRAGPRRLVRMPFSQPAPGHEQRHQKKECVTERVRTGSEIHSRDALPV